VSRLWYVNEICQFLAAIWRLVPSILTAEDQMARIFQELNVIYEIFYSVLGKVITYFMRISKCK
jgi:uncharacterized membrane protein YjjB (DUF3815 family)